ncbi:MAB_1171c family putative transporter [Streptacidiphilus sp. P02-A3a]|uniref:MAB_1171c family putative transporter n=1 Tax=Streptacidiphilus sp. P02-A3a TaxID=2704468 RepID=UPI0015FB3589|nr:MAB_1171c family putative transporter [Streptacidiphilus sp. P02-A3a]QMU71489.1 hypothetical protein GXP74_27890 [Streptacidiphilus sp. P02-A3a]
MSDALVYLSALMVGVLGLSRLVLVRHDGVIPAVRHGTTFALTQAAAMVVAAPESIALIGRRGPFPNAPVLIGDLLRLTAAGSLLLLADHVPAAGRTRSGWPRAVAALVRPPLGRLVLPVAVLLFLCARTGELHGAETATGDAHRLLLAGYDLTVMLYTCCCLAVLAAALRRCARELDDGLLRRGVTLLRVSVLVGTAWAAWGTDDVVDVLRGGIQQGGEDPVSAVLGLACVSVAVLGATVSLWSPVTRAVSGWLADYRRYRALGPLWQTLHRQLPQIALRTPSRWRAWLPPLYAHFALYRRIIEIHDAQLVLRTAADGATAGPAPAPGSGPGSADLRLEAETLLRGPALPAAPATRAAVPAPAPARSSGRTPGGAR